MSQMRLPIIHAQGKVHQKIWIFDKPLNDFTHNKRLKIKKSSKYMIVPNDVIVDAQGNRSLNQSQNENMGQKVYKLQSIT